MKFRLYSRLYKHGINANLTGMQISNKILPEHIFANGLVIFNKLIDPTISHFQGLNPDESAEVKALYTHRSLVGTFL